MLVIRDQQLNVFMKNAKDEIKLEYLKRLRTDLRTQTACLSDVELQVLVSESLKAAEILRITDNEDVYRFLKLRFVPKKLMESKLVKDSMYRVLTNVEKDSSKRIDFIERNVVSRK